MKDTRTPNALPVRWEVRRKADSVLLGVVVERLWFDARELASQRYGLDRGQIELAPVEDEEPKPRANGSKKKR